MRGGTSTGPVLWERYAPAALPLREELARHLMGQPTAGRDDDNRQITGLGRGTPTSNKVFFAGLDIDAGGPVLLSTLAQLAHNHGDVDWSVNCGNMSATLQPWARATGLPGPGAAGPADIRIRNTNTGVTTVSRMTLDAAGRAALATIPGVDGAWPAVDLFMLDPAGAKTGTLLPTGLAADIIDGCRVSCVDVALPMIIVDARDLERTAHEPIASLSAGAPFMARLLRIRIAAGLKMGLRTRDGNVMTAIDLARSETIPKICIAGAPRAGGNIAVRYFTPQQPYPSMAVSGGCCLAAAVLLPGSMAHAVAARRAAVTASYADVRVGIEHPAGVLDATDVCRLRAGRREIRSAAYRRTAQILLRCHVPLYGASAALRAALLG